VYNSKKLLGVGYEAAKLIPSAAKSMAKGVINYPETQRKGIEAFKQLRQIPLEKQKEMLAQDIQRIGESKKGNDNQRKLAQIGLGILGNYSQYSRPAEKIYNEPFSFALDVIPAAKSLGVGKALAKGGKTLNKIPAVAKVTEQINDAFVPMGKLKRVGYTDVAEDLSKTQANIRKSQGGIIESTVRKFEKEFKLSKAEKTDFFEIIDKGRRTPDYVPISTNPKVQRAIDWYMKKELPKIQKIAGYNKTKEATKFKYIDDNATAASRLPNIVDEEADLMLSMQKEFGGVDTHIKNETLYGGDTGIVRHSTNPQWYRDYYKEYGRSPSKKVVKEIATQELERGKGMLSDEYQMLTNLLDELKEAKKNPANYKKVSETYNKAPIQNYLHHFFNPTKEAQFGGKLSSPQRGFLKQSKDIEGFVKDPVVSIAGVKSKAATANIKEAFINRLFKKHGVSADNVTEIKGGKFFNKTTGEELAKHKGEYLPKDLADELSRIETGEAGWVKTILAPSRAFNRNWKPLATSVRPRYHLRNIIGNLYNASFVGGMNPLRVFPAAAQQMKGFIAQNIKDGTLAGKIYKAFFKETPDHKWIKMATDDNVIGNGFFSVDINDMADIADTVEDFSKVIAKTKNPALVYKIPVLRQWMNGMQKFGSAIEDNAKLALYMDRIKKGASRIDAKKYVDKHLFDYINGLGDADKAIKAIIPFWSWRRFNVPLQFGALGRNPLRHLIIQEGGKPFVAQNEAENPEYKYLSEREKAMGAIKTGETTKNGKVMDTYMRTQNVLPIQDIASLTDPDNMGITPMFDMLKQGYNLINPPANAQSNLDYFGRPVESYPGEAKRYLGTPVRGTAKEVLQSVPLLSELNKLLGGSYDEKNRPDLMERIKTVTLPTSQTIQDREKNRQYFESDYQRKFGTGTMQPGYLSELKYTAKKLIENPSDTVSQRNMRTLIDLMKQGGMSEQQIEIEIMKSIQSQLKKESPKPTRPTRVKRPTPTIDQYYANEVNKRASNFKPYFTD
jgi:uncharacterized protein with HEPN domain